MALALNLCCKSRSLNMSSSRGANFTGSSSRQPPDRSPRGESNLERNEPAGAMHQNGSLRGQKLATLLATETLISSG